MLGEHPEIRHAVVMMREVQPGDKILVAYIIPVPGVTLDMGKLRGYLREKLPAYMIPTIFMQMDAFPLTSTGKIDRQALPRPEIGTGKDIYLAPRDETEMRLVSIWREILGVEKIGVKDNFFELGGHSLLAVRLFARIQEEFGQSLPLILMFENGTVEALAESLAIEKKSFLERGIVFIKPQGTRTPFFIISPGLDMRDLALALPPEQPVFGLNPVENGKTAYRKSVQDTAKILYRVLIDFYPKGPYSLIAHSAFGYFTVELARLLIQNGNEVCFLGLLDSYPPGARQKTDQVDRVKTHITAIRDKNLTGDSSLFWRVNRPFRHPLVEAGDDSVKLLSVTKKRAKSKR